MPAFRHLFASLLVSALPLVAEESGPATNHLAGEKSPYLLQHASNPVDWYPWGEAAFDKARKENKPIFLSVGYSTCHWCHVMARESFTDPEIAKLMNDGFVNIKVDREERPDVDQVYMAFVQATTGSGGWPMSVWLTPELKPFVGGTYFPPEDREGMPGFKSVLRQLAKAWKEHETEVRSTAGDVTEQLRKMAAGTGIADELPPATALGAAYKELVAAFDPEEGGFGTAPKFPRPVTLDFLHHEAAVRGDAARAEKALQMARTTLRKMAAGGMHDHLGGGFHRYSVDRFWHIPHYEKMLYDQAQLAVAYLDAARLGGGPEFQATARDILGYVSRRMTSPEGGFYSAEDADSLKSLTAEHKTEGAFYIWEKKEIDELVGQDAPLFDAVYGVEAAGNAPAGSDPQGELKGTNTLIRRLGDGEAAAKFDLTKDAVAGKLASARKVLFEAREKRPHPHLDDKILTAWNGLMISAYAKAYQQLGDPSDLAAATRAAGFIREKLYDPQRGVLLRSYREGPAKIEGFAADYAFLIQGLLDLYEAGFDTRWLAWADTLQAKQDALFLDAEGGGYFSSAGGDAHVLLRSKEAYDGAEPSENSISALNLQRLAAMLDQPERANSAGRVLRAFAPQIEKSPTSAPKMLVALDIARRKPAQIVIAGTPGAEDTEALLSIVRQNPRPRQIVLLADGGAGQEYLAGKAPFYASLGPRDGAATVYVCENFVCNLPITDPQKLRELLHAK